MLSFISLAALAITLYLTFESVVPASAHRLTPGDLDSSIENSYIVKLKDGVNITNHINSLPFLFSVKDATSPVTHWWPDFFKGYSGIFVGAALDAILASPDVKYVEKNGIASAADFQTDAPWNLQAVSTQNPVGGTDASTMAYTYSYTQPIGDGVDIYIIDSGVYTDHEEFEGRATFGWAGRGLQMVDDYGHGTRMAGIAAGKTYGVAKKANIIAVKVLKANGKGNIADIIDGLDWVSANVKSTRRPSIACTSLGSDYSQGLDDAAYKLIASGVTLVAAAGNNGRDAKDRSPAHVITAITVGASDITNTMWRKSSFGQVVDIFAPGVDIISAWTVAGVSSVGTGTSAAAAHVAGIAANFLSQNPRMIPDDIYLKIRSLAIKRAISGVPAGTVNDLVFNGGSR